MNRRVITVLIAVIIILALVPTTLAKDEVNLTYLSWYAQPGRMEVEEEIIEWFNELHDGIRVEFLGVPGSVEAFEQVLLLTAAGVPPDVAAIQRRFGIPVLSDIAIDLTPYVEADQFDLEQFRSHAIDMGIIDGRIYGVPWGYGETTVWYNKAHFREMGLPDPYYGWTMDEFLMASKQLTRDTNGDGNIDTFAISTSRSSWWDAWIPMFGGYLMDPVTEELGMTEPGFIEGATWYTNLWLEHQIVGGSFTTGTTTMATAYEGIIPQWISSNLHETVEWAATYYPRQADGDVYATGGGHVMSIIESTPYPDEAWEFIKFYNSRVAQEIVGRNSLYPSTRLGLEVMVEESVLPPGYTTEDIYRTFAFQRPNVVIPYDYFPGAGDVYREIGLALEAVTFGEEPVRTAVQRLKPVVEMIISDARGN